MSRNSTGISWARQEREDLLGKGKGECWAPGMCESWAPASQCSKPSMNEYHKANPGPQSTTWAPPPQTTLLDKFSVLQGTI